MMDPRDDHLDVIEAIHSTRAMRRLKPDPVPDEVLWRILDAAIRGPSSGNVQRWGWVVVTDPAIKARIGRWYLEAWNALGEGRRAKLKRLARGIVRSGDAGNSPVGDDEPDVNRRSGAYLAQHIAEAPVWIFATQRGITGTPTLVDGADIFGAIQNLMLAARKYGLGSTLTMLHRRYERDVAALLGLPSDVATIALLPLGYPVSAFSTPVRHPVETVVHWEHWGATRQRPRGVLDQNSARGIA